MNLKGRRDSDVRPKRRSELQPGDKGIYMDEALSRTSKWAENLSNNPTLKAENFKFPHRIRNLQLYLDFFGWNVFNICIPRNLWRCLHNSSCRMWFEFDSKWQRNFKCNFVCWHNLFVLFMGLFSRYKRST